MTITTPVPATVEFRDLLTVDTTPKVTIIVPVDHTDSRQDAISVRNLVKHAASLLEERGAAPKTSSELLDPITDIVRSAHPLSRSVPAVALFTAPGHQQLIPLITPTPEYVYVADEFHVVPLVESLDPIHCFVLTITRGGCHLWRSDRWRIAPMNLPDAPGALSDITRFRDLEQQLQLHATARGGFATFHGQGVDEDVEFEPVRTYLRAVDAAVGAGIRNDAAPLLLVGPGRLPAIYRTVSALRDFLPAVEAHPDGFDERDLQAKAAAAVHGMAGERTARLLDQIGSLGSSGKSSADPAEVARAAQAGRVRTLLFDPSTDDRARVNLAIVNTLRRGGEALPAVSAATTLAAIFRY
ncbi:MAG: hypothetical protein V3V29_06195 [Acidimicrobiia bacterium]